MLNLFTCLSLILKNLSSLTLLMNILHWAVSVVLVTMDVNLDLLLFMLPPLCSIVTFIHLTLSCRRCFSAFHIISLAPLLILLQDDLSLTLTRTIPLLMHLNVNLLWFFVIAIPYNTLFP